MSLPFFETLTHCFPQSRVDIIAKETVKDIFRHHPAIRMIHAFSKSRTSGLHGLFAYGRRLQQQYGPYDLFITLPSSFSAAMLGYGVGSRIRLGFRSEGRSMLLTHKTPEPHGIHRAHIYRSLLTFFKRHLEQHRQCNDLEMQEVLQDQEIPSICFPFSPAEQRTPFLQKQPGTTYIVLSVNSEAQSRRLSLKKWTELGNRLLSDSTYHVTLIFIGIQREQSRVASVIEGLDDRERVYNFAGHTSIRQLAMLLRDADAVVANDSGPMHLANAVGTPVVTFFGAGDPVETAPFNRNHTIVLNKHVPCSPCVKNTCRYATIHCLEQITVDEIYQNLLTLLQVTA